MNQMSLMAILLPDKKLLWSSDKKERECDIFYLGQTTPPNHPV